MKRYFVDAVHFIALANPKDQSHDDALRMASTTADDGLVTTEDVLIELLNFYAGSGEFMRQKVVDLTRSILVDARIDIVLRTNTTVLEALELYESRLDKGYILNRLHQ